MNTSTVKQLGQCECGENTFKITGEPLFRAICHCEICQEFNDAPFADITLYRSKDVDFPGENKIEYKAYTNPPMAQRGRCTACHKPTIEFLKIPVMPGLTIVPSKNLANADNLPAPSLHVFYHRRIQDAEDILPKYSGYIKSQLVFMGKLIGALIRS
ncbi:MAG: hypothetical protein ACI9DH_000207 [Halioglobus sp.]|jgi:hypothetical protein